MASPHTTPAGSQINSDWADLQRGIRCFVDYIKANFGVSSKDWYVMFRCGTIARVALTDHEFKGYLGSEYVFPEHPENHKETVASIMADNQHVWEVQRAIPGPVGAAIRRGYGLMIAQGYPYPGTQQAGRTPIEVGRGTQPGEVFWVVYWPNQIDEQLVYNLAFATSTEGPTAAAARAGDLRRYDFMFPEVAAVVTPDLKVWTYGPDRLFSDKHSL